jgi:hypothetical protein
MEYMPMIWPIVLFLISLWAVPFFSVVVLGAFGALVAEEGGAAVGSVLGWIVGACWWVYAVIQIIVRVIDLIQAIVAGA